MAEAALAAGVERNRKIRDTEKVLSQNNAPTMDDDDNIQQERDRVASLQSSTYRDSADDCGNNYNDVTAKKRKAMEQLQ